MILLRPTQMCWICGKAVTPETLQSDEHGSTVHARCHAVRRALASASYTADRVTAIPAGLQRIKPSAARSGNGPSAMLKTGTD